MSKLFTFLENFDITNKVRIIEGETLLFEGEMGDVPQKISNMMSVVRGTVIDQDGVIIIRVKKCS